MTRVQKLMVAISEQAITKVTEKIDLVRLGYKLKSNTVRDAAEFDMLLADFMKCMYRDCLAPGSQLPDFEAIGRGKELLERTGRRRGLTIMNYLNFCMEGNENGARGVLDAMTEGCKSEVTQRYIDSVIDQHFPIDSTFGDKLAIMTELFAVYGDMLPSSIRSKQPEYFASHYKTLLQELAANIRENSRQFRAV